jgi:hypothetical protein
VRPAVVQEQGIQAVRVGRSDCRPG